MASLSPARDTSQRLVPGLPSESEGITVAAQQWIFTTFPRPLENFFTLDFAEALLPKLDLGNFLVILSCKHKEKVR